MPLINAPEWSLGKSPLSSRGFPPSRSFYGLALEMATFSWPMARDLVMSGQFVFLDD